MTSSLLRVSFDAIEGGRRDWVEEVRGSVVFHGAAVGTWPTDNDEVEDA